MNAVASTTASSGVDEFETRVARLSETILATSRQIGPTMSEEAALAEARRRLTPEPEPEPALPAGWDEEQVDRLTRALYEARAQSPRLMDDERWARTKARFGSSVRICRADVIAQIESGDFGD